MKITLEDGKDIRTFELTEAQEKAFKYIAFNPLDWIENAILNRIRQAKDEIVGEHSDRQPHKIQDSEKDTIVLSAPIKSAKERQAELEAELKGRL